MLKSRLRASALAASLLTAAVFAIIGPREAHAQFAAPRSSSGAGQFGLSVSAATGLTVPARTTLAYICIETQAARWRDDGTAPTATVGQPVAAGSCFWYSGPFASIQFIAQTTGAVIDVSYYR